ncbi:nuclear transport factor 2 family protein [Erythrobacter sp. JK5]|uniref:nuclear transport factor 2 family protein n=1 Tax=Erythrobacter sp. JK5 TaxID=2829500 RepID=UPI001BA86997|nr:nuclear transport factor 2 family protein [Erythrobacter sp. JK5]QUL38876.1 nuclear transport factor 2 family protein [Erythrobacter sp. JK5]
MADISAEIETLEHRFMRAWMKREKSELKKLLTRDFLLVMASPRPELLDRPSFLEACQGDFHCSAYRMREVFSRQHGKSVWFTAGFDLEMKLGRLDWKGEFWISDLWRKNAFGRGWKLAERSLARMEPDEVLAHAMHRLQLWN